MKTESWEHVKMLIGEDLAMFTVFMSSIQANEIISGFMKLAKGANYLSEQTIEEMYHDFLTGICRDTLESKLDPDQIEAEMLDDSIFARGIDDLRDWLEMTTEEESSEYFDYLSRWDLDGHNWNTERPITFSSYEKAILPS